MQQQQHEEEGEATSSLLLQQPGEGGLLMEFFVSMVTPGMVGPRLERLLFGCLGALALVLVLVWWRAGPDVAPHALALLALTALLAASLFWSFLLPHHALFGEMRATERPKDARPRGKRPGKAGAPSPAAAPAKMEKKKKNKNKGKKTNKNKKTAKAD